MAARLYCFGKSPIDEVTYTATIYDADWSGANTFVECQDGGINISYDAKGTDDRYGIVLGSTASVEMLVRVTDTTLSTFLDDLRTSSEGRFSLEITSDGDYPVVWRGVVVADHSSEKDTAALFEATIKAVDGIALLKNTPYLNAGAIYTGKETLIGHMINVLTRVHHSSFWGASDPIVETSMDWWPTSVSTGGANDSFKKVSVGHEVFYDYHTTGGVEKDVLSCYDVISHIVSAFGCRIYQFGGLFRVEQIQYRANASYIYRRYLTDGTLSSYGTHSGTSVIDQTENGAKLTAVEFDYLPQMRKAAVTYLAKNQRNLFALSFLSSNSAPVHFDQEISSSGSETFRLKGNIHFTLNNISNPATFIVLAELRMLFKIGDNWLERTASYSNFSAYYGNVTWQSSTVIGVRIATDAITLPAIGSSQTRIIPFDIITPELPDDGSDNTIFIDFIRLIKSDGTTFSFIPGSFSTSFYTFDMSVQAYNLGTPDVLSDEILYEAANPNDGTENWERKILFGINSEPNEAGRLTYYTDTGGVYTNAVAWGAGVETPAYKLGQMLARTVLNGQLRPTKRMNGTLFGPLDPFKLVQTTDGIDWLVHRIEWTPVNNEIKGSWIEVDYGTSGVVASPVKIKLTQGNDTPILNGPGGTVQTGNGNQGFASNSPATILAPVAFNFMSTEIAEGATVTQIDLLTASEGDEFLAGDGVTVVHPITGRYQTFEIDTPPAAGDLFLSVVPEVADFAMPENASLVVKQKAFSFKYTAEQAQDDVFGIVVDSDTIDFTYDDAAPSFTGIVKDASIVTGKIANDAVTFEKIQNISAASKLIGRGSAAGAGNVEEITLGTNLSMSGTTLNAAGGSYTNEEAQDAVGSILADTATIDFTYDDATPQISAIVKDASISTAKIIDDAVTLAKLQNAAANNIVLGNIAGAGQPYVELTVAQLQTLLAFIDGTGVANRFAFWLDANTLSNDVAFTLDPTNDRVTFTGTVAGTGAGNALLNLNAGAITPSMEFLRASATVANEMIGIFANARNVGNSGNTKFVLEVGGTAAGDPFLLFSIPGGTSHVLGVDNTDADKLKLTPGGTAPGSIANKGICITTDAASLVGINTDNPAYTLDVNGIVRSPRFINGANIWGSGNIAFGFGAGTGPSLQNIIGGYNGLRITFTTGTAPTADGIVFTATFPVAWPGGPVHPVFSARNKSAAANIAGFHIDDAATDATKFVLRANGSLPASTQFILSFNIKGFGT